MVISPKNANEIVEIKNKIDNNKSNVLNAYKKSEIYKELAPIQDGRIKKSIISKFFLKKYNETHAEDITRLLMSKTADSKKNCYSFDIKELIDFSLLQSDFLDICQIANDELFSMIKENFPEIDMNESRFYQTIKDYLESNRHKVLDDLCVMCGKTLITEEIVGERIAFLSKKINDYNDKISSNDFFQKLNEFSSEVFFSELFIKFQKDILNKKSNDLIVSLSKIGEALKGVDVKQLTANATDCILDKIREDKNISNILNEMNNLESKLKKLKEDNKDKINEETKRKFVENLEKFQFKYFDKMNVELNSESNTLTIKFQDVTMDTIFSDVLSESEKSILSFSLFKSIINDNRKTMIIVDDPVDSHDQKNKWFILNNVIDIAVNSKSLIIIMTHDLSLAKALNQTESGVYFTNFILSKKSIDEIKGPSLFFSDIYDFVFKVFREIESSYYNDNEKYFLPLAFLIRYLSKNQYKLLNEIDCWQSTPLDSDTITRERTKIIGFKDISNDIAHYNSSVDSEKLLDNLVILLKLSRKSTNKPEYFKSSTPTDLLLESIINDIGRVKQFEKELSKIMSAVLIRNLLEKKFVSSIEITIERTLSDYAKTYHSKKGNDAIYMFYMKNKAMVDEFAHLESGIDALLTYDDDYIKKQLALIKSL